MGRAGLCLAVLLALALSAEEPFEFGPGAQYDSRIPTFRQTLGYDPCAQITSSAGILRYLDALAGATNRIKVFPYAESSEKRKLIYAAIGSTSYPTRTPAVRAATHALPAS